MIDTHSHIYAPEFDSDRAQVVQRAIERGVTQFVLPAIDALSHSKLFEVAATYPNHYPTIGVHPTSIKEDYQRELDTMREIFTRERQRIVAIGEIGLDLYWDKTFRQEQERALRMELDMAIENNLPAIIHTRDAYSEMVSVMSDYKGSPLRVVFHSFSGSLDDARTLLSFGDHLLGIGGVVTFKKSTLGDVVREVGVSKIVLETDAPYLAPVPHRGSRNESSYIPDIAAHIGTLLAMEPGKIDEITTNNAKKLFNI